LPPIYFDGISEEGKYGQGVGVIRFKLDTSDYSFWDKSLADLDNPPEPDELARSKRVGSDRGFIRAN